MSIIKQYHQDTNTTYVYESEYYYDKDKKQSRSKRKLIGKIDEETGNVIPTGKRGRKKKTPVADNKASAAAGEDTVHTSGAIDGDIKGLMEKVEEQESANIQLKLQMSSMEEGYMKLLTEKDDTIKDLQSKVKKLEGVIVRARQSLSKAMGSLDDA